MSKSKRRKHTSSANSTNSLPPINKDTYNCDEYVNLHAEAYYRAMKRFDDEKSKMESAKVTLTKRDTFANILKMIFWETA